MRGTVGLWATWLISRALLVLVPAGARHTGHDVQVYAAWSKIILRTGFPVDPRWQYPPLAAPIMVAPRLIPFLGYAEAFVLLALAADLAVMALLLRRGARPVGAWTWTVGLFLLGTVVHLRYDLFVTAFAVAALLALPRKGLFGALAGVGAMLKVWPVLLLLGLGRDRGSLKAVLAFAAVVAAVLVGGWLYDPGQLGFLGGQRDRGLEIEAVAVTPWQVARLFGHETKIVHEYGCAQFAIPGAWTLGLVCQLATLLGLALVAYLSWRRDSGTCPADVALAATLVCIVTSRVLSPQYLIWVVGLGAVAMTYHRTRQGPVVVMILIAAALTQLVFPIGWDGLQPRDPDALAVLALTARNLLLLAATITAVARLRATPLQPVARRPHLIRQS
ncbi:glycosyltransferase 87 family protein [Nonomuraea sp. NPDC050556]|uniref:glycosyltransferase 87 family protein n=1 Tax=Nonomuraea sp. NPDC050556 TaxID=3364369 RepID=UPI003793C2FE